MNARFLDTAPRGITETDRLTTPWPFAALVHFLRRAVTGAVTSIYAWHAGVREHSSDRWVSQQWLAEHELQSSKHEEHI